MAQSIINISGVTSHKSTLYNHPISLRPSIDGIEFGKHNAIAPNLKVIGINHDYNYPAIQETFYKKFFNLAHPSVYNPSIVRNKGKITIGSDVWIGEDVIILSGVTIGNGCCIGAKSVVTRNLAPYSVCVGTPCKEVKKRYNDDIIAFLQELKWWDWDVEKIIKNKTFFYTNLNEISVDDLKKLII